MKTLFHCCLLLHAELSKNHEEDAEVDDATELPKQKMDMYTLRQVRFCLLLLRDNESKERLVTTCAESTHPQPNCHLFQTLQEMGKRKKKLTVYEVLRNDTVDFMDKVFRYNSAWRTLSFFIVVVLDAGFNVCAARLAKFCGILESGIERD